MEDYELLDTIVMVEPEQADREGLHCPYCCGAELTPHERLRDEPHEACLGVAERYMAESADNRPD